MKFSEPAGRTSTSIERCLPGRGSILPSTRDFNAHLPGSLDSAKQIYNGGNCAPDGSIVRKQISADSDFELPAASVVVLCVRL
jgi:hypothetical protein